MGGVGFVEHRGKKVLQIDFKGCELDEFVRIIRESKKLITKEPHASVLTLTDVTDAHLNPMASKVLKEFTTFNKPYVKAGAVLGVKGLLKLEFDIVMKFSGRSLARFDAKEAALDWLATQ